MLFEPNVCSRDRSVAGDAAKGAIQKSATEKTGGILGRRKPK